MTEEDLETLIEEVIEDLDNSALDSDGLSREESITVLESVRNHCSSRIETIKAEL